MKRVNKSLNIVFQHPDFVVIDKPAGLLSVPERFTDETSAKKLLRDQFGEIYAVHRLDKDTSGLMIFAKNKDSHKIFNQLFEERKITKRYHALVLGSPIQSSDTIDQPILRLPGKNEVVIDKKGQAAQSVYRVLESFQSYALLEVDLLTGRTHQIRVHLRSIGHPLIVDPTYGVKTELLVSEIKGQRRFNLAKEASERPILSRTPLHSHYLAFTYPGLHNDKPEEIELSSNYPKDMKASLQQIRKWNSV